MRVHRESKELAHRLFAAFEEGDEETVRALCSPDLVVIQNRGQELTLDALLEFVAAVQGVVRDFRYEDAVCHGTEHGFVEDHLACGTLPDGSELRLPACVLAEVRDGKVTLLRETVDGAAALPLLRALR